VTISLTEVSVSYGKKAVLHKLSLQAESGRVLGIVGPNGSGKSTLVKAVAGLVPVRGSIAFDGAAIRPAAIGYMPQDNLAPMALTVLELVLLGRIAHLRLTVQPDDLQAVARTLEVLDISALAGCLVGEISGGQRQLVFLAQALVAEPTILMLDEPTSALDISHQLEVLDTVRTITHQRSLTTLMVLHDLNAAARYCDDIALLHGGQLVHFGTPSATLTTAHVRRLFNVETEALQCADGTGVLVATHQRQHAATGG
jgi:iron complex transport system ATP-binding protein